MAKRISAKTAESVKRVQIAQKINPRRDKKSSPQKNTSRLVNQHKPKIILLLTIVIVISFLYLGRGLFIAAIVNGQPIGRILVVRELEKQAGKKALDSLITKTLILQEAKRQNINVNQKEIDQEIKKLEKRVAVQGQKLDDLLLAQGLTRQGLIEQIRIQVMIEKILARDITVTDGEVNEYIETNKLSLPQGLKPQEIKEDVREQLKQQKLGKEFQTFIESVKNKAKIIYFVNY